jgi:hypothetical protein
MKKIGFAFLSFVSLLAPFQSCKKVTPVVVDFSKYTITNNECQVTQVQDTTQWINDVLTQQQDTTLLTFLDNISIADSVPGKITISAPCANPSNGFFIWNVNPTRQCKLKVVCANTDGDILYYNSYGLNGGPITLGYDFRALTVFHKNTNYRMYFGFYNGRDSLYFSGHGDIRIQ